MIEKIRVFGIGSVAAATTLIAGCGIDQGGIEGPGLPPGEAASQTTVVSGPITGFGSVLVNDLTLDTSAAQILIDGQFSTEADLSVGQIIRAVAIEDNGQLLAVTIEHDENLSGPVEIIDAAAGTLTMLGQSVIIDAETQFDTTVSGIVDVQANDSIVVSGLSLPSGELQATFIRRADPNEDIQITASISDLDLGNLTFELGNLTVDYSQAILLQLLTGIPELNLVVEVKGTSLVNGVLAANEVRARVSLPGVLNAAATSLSDFEIPLVSAAAGSSTVNANFVGHITASNLPGSITLVDIEVEIDVGTVIDGGALGDLNVGTRVQIEGNVASFGRIQATRIKVF